MRTEWTDEKKEKVAALLKEGFSASVIGDELGVTRNAIIGLVNREQTLLNVGFKRISGSGRIRDTDAKRPYRSVKPRAPRSERPKMIVPPETGNLHVVGRPFMALSAFECKWSMTSVSEGDQHLFCGCHAAPGKPYCDYHAKRGVTPYKRKLPVGYLVSLAA